MLEVWDSAIVHKTISCQEFGGDIDMNNLPDVFVCERMAIWVINPSCGCSTYVGKEARTLDGPRNSSQVWVVPRC